MIDSKRIDTWNIAENSKAEKPRVSSQSHFRRIDNYNMTRKILVTNALPYANGPIHLGHLVGYIQADIWVRFQRMQGNDVTYVCADDAHGTPIMLKAEADGVTPEQLIAGVLEEHKRDFKDFLVEFDNYHTTHSDEN